MKDIEKLLKDCKVILARTKSIAYLYADRLVYACIEQFLPYKDYDFFPIFRTKLPPVTYRTNSDTVIIEPVHAGLTFAVCKNTIDARFSIATMGRVTFERSYRYEHSMLRATYTTPISPDSLMAYVVILALRDKLVERMLNSVTSTLIALDKRLCESDR